MRVCHQIQNDAPEQILTLLQQLGKIIKDIMEISHNAIKKQEKMMWRNCL
jgi:ACT domain-containing protein